MRPDLLSRRGPAGLSTTAWALRPAAAATAFGKLAHDRLVVVSQLTLGITAGLARDSAPSNPGSGCRGDAMLPFEPTRPAHCPALPALRRGVTAPPSTALTKGGESASPKARYGLGARWKLTPRLPPSTGRSRTNSPWREGPSSTASRRWTTRSPSPPLPERRVSSSRLDSPDNPSGPTRSGGSFAPALRWLRRFGFAPEPLSVLDGPIRPQPGDSSIATRKRLLVGPALLPAQVEARTSEYYGGEVSPTAGTRLTFGRRYGAHFILPRRGLR